jgi:septum formation protein
VGRSDERNEAETWTLAAEVLEGPLILASASPRRADLLAQVGIPYEVHVSDVAEEADLPGVPPAEVAETHARDKALDVAAQRPGRLVLGADTVVVLDGRVLGKPEDAADAQRMLRALSGRGHAVITAVAFALGEQGSGEPAPRLVALEHVRTQVQFRTLDEDEIEAYVASGEPMDKAGGYGIQGRGALLVREIAGCYFSVVGLPLSRTWELLRDLGHGIPGAQDDGDRGRGS